MIITKRPRREVYDENLEGGFSTPERSRGTRPKIDKKRHPEKDKYLR
jgi:hypothetical protein